MKSTCQIFLDQWILNRSYNDQSGTSIWKYIDKRFQKQYPNGVNYINTVQFIIVLKFNFAQYTVESYLKYRYWHASPRGVFSQRQKSWTSHKVLTVINLIIHEYIDSEIKQQYMSSSIVSYQMNTSKFLCVDTNMSVHYRIFIYSHGY